MSKYFLLIFLIGVSLFANELKPITLQFQWKHQFEFAGFYAAKEKGYFKDAGLDVNFLEYDGKEKITSSVLNKKADFGLTYASLIAEYLNGKPLVFIANYFKQSPLVLVTQENIKLPGELKNKKVMGLSDEIDSITFKLMLNKFGVSLQDIKNIPTTFNLKDFIDKKVDAMTVFTTNELYYLDKLGIKYNILNPSVYGHEYYDVNLFTSKEFALKNPAVVKKFKEASNKGWEYALSHKEEIANLIIKQYNTQNKSLEALLFEAKQIEQIMLTKSEPIGSINFSRLQFIAKNFIQANYVNNSEKLDTLNDFVFGYSKYAEVNTKLTKLTKEERKFLDNNPIIKVYMDYAYPPYSFVENNQIKGFSVEYANLLSNLLGTEFEYITNMTWNQALESLKNKKIDMIGQMVNTKDRRNFTLFSENYYSYYTGVMVKKRNKSFRSLKSLEGHTVGLVQGYYEENLLRKHYPKINIKTYKDNNELIKAILDDKCDATIQTYQVLEYLINKKGLTNKLVSTPLKIEPMFDITKEAFGIRKDWNLLQSALNKAIVLTQANRHNLEAKWLRDKSKQEKSLNTINLTQNEQEYLKSKEFISMCVDPDWEPYEWIDEKGVYKGIVSQFIKRVEKNINKKIKLIPTESWVQSLEYVQNGQCEILSFLNQTPQRDKFLNFTPVLYDDIEVIVANDDISYLDGFESLEGKTIGLVNGYSTDEYVKKKHPNIKIRAIKNNKEGLELLSQRKIFATVNSLLGTVHHIKKANFYDIKIAGKTSLKNQYRIGVNKEDTVLQTILSKAVSNISEKEKSDILSNWVSVKFEQEFNYDLFYKLFALFVLVLFFLVYRHYSIAKINKRLKNKMKEQLNQIVEKDRMLFEQNKFVSMGEMIENIAHQWRQPLSQVNSAVLTLDNQLYKIGIKDKLIEDKLSEIESLSKYMSNTIDDFKSLYSKDKNKKNVKVHKCIDNALSIVKATLSYEKIDVFIEANEDISINEAQNELEQVLLVILNNAKDALVLKKVEKPKITISLFKENDTIKITVFDNAGSIKNEIFERMFEPYFTTKHQSQGTGLGLYISKRIIEESMNGKLYAIQKNGVIYFIIELTSRN